MTHLHGIQQLDLIGCRGKGGERLSITCDALVHLKGVRVLDLSYCVLAVPLEALTKHIKRVKDLRLTGCTDATGILPLDLTDAVLRHLAGKHTLHIDASVVSGLTVGVGVQDLLYRVEGISCMQVLDLGSCKDCYGEPLVINDKALDRLRGPASLRIYGAVWALLHVALNAHMAGMAIHVYRDSLNRTGYWVALQRLCSDLWPGLGLACTS
jgi:hypothetical protein